MLPIVEINPKGKITASVIWMHGLGADGNDFADIVPQLHLPDELGVRFVFPHAPMRSVTWAGGMRLRAWFNVDRLDLNAKQDAAGLHESQQLIEELVAAELARGIVSNRIILAGFSQGGALALQCGLRYPEPLAGIMVLSAWLPLADTVAQEKNPNNQNTPILMVHGTVDPLIPIAWSQQSCDYLRDLGYQVNWQTFAMPHSVCPEEVELIGAWLRELLG